MAIHVTSCEEVAVTYWVGGRSSGFSYWIVPGTLSECFGSDDLQWKGHLAALQMRIATIRIESVIRFWYPIGDGPVYLEQSEVVMQWRKIGPHFRIGRIREKNGQRELEIVI